MLLALHLGRTHNELKETMSASELSRWQTYARTYGLPHTRLEWAVANAGAASANCAARTHVFDPQDLIPEVYTPPTYDQWCAAFGAWAKHHNKKPTPKNRSGKAK